MATQHLIIPFASRPQPRPQLKRNGGKAHYGSQEFMDFKLKLTNLIRCKFQPVRIYPVYLMTKYHIKVDKNGHYPKSDVDNHQKVLIDCIVQAGILTDDNMNYLRGTVTEVIDSTSDMFEFILTDDPKKAMLAFFALLE